MDEKVAEAILIQLAQINANLSKLSERIDKFVVDLGEFSERFEDVVTQLEDERRLDIIRDYD